MSVVSDFLRNVPLFAGFPEEDLERLCEMIDEVHLQQGELLFAEGDAGDRAYIIKSGELEIIKQSSGREVLLAVRRQGEVIGEMSLLEESPRSASVRARSKTILLAVSQDQFLRLLDTSSSAARVMLNTVLDRWRSTEASLKQSEKLALIGNMSAGLAHELNNPAAAVQRGAEQLQAATEVVQEAQSGLYRLELNGAQLDILGRIEQAARQNAAEPDSMDALTRADLQEELEDWLD
ncbi:MAG: cyclic nucleotide-binding domain-containing protein, partial [Anaerolineales bacterium]|nr:cyclic nucleotide-binding domain-containing protein [Anaerolineales bacterium]